MKYLLDRDQMKEIDRFSIRETKIPSVVLMERAALAVCEKVNKLFDTKSRVLCVCGNGNNGADAAACARILAGMEFDTAVCFVGSMEKTTEEMKLQMQINEKIGIKTVTLDKIPDYDVIIDGIFGIGLSREVTGAYGEAIRCINEAPGKKISVDIPSGINASDGKVLGNAVKADYTVTFGYLKTGLILYPGNEYAGEIVVSDCGFAPAAIEHVGRKKFIYETEDIRRLPVRKQDSNKGTYGKVLVIAGSKNMCGAAYFSAKAAYRCGAGLVRILTAADNREALQKLLPEAVLSFYDDISWENLKEQIAWADTLVIGPGLSTGEKAAGLLYDVLKILEEFGKTTKKVLLDADALNILSRDQAQDKVKGCVITPHLGEMSRLIHKEIPEIKGNIIKEAEEFAERYGCVCVLKDARTIVSDGENIYVNVSGNSGMATAGSGDVLTGIIAGMYANGMEIFEGAALGTYLHGCAGDEAKKRLGEYFMKADDIADNIKNVINV
ncbi:MAG: NAD(P)H-hydrate dehydratase [Thermoflexaceae bacterium]|nr:NAD(P)H-hydrate dehydratase [Thermoflexaceae bacterium]